MKLTQPKHLEDFIQDTMLFSLKCYVLHEACFYELVHQ